eukprot:15458168-Alexandrium_andersonii.AAC.1
MANQAAVLCQLLRNPAVKRLINTAKSGVRMVRNEPSLREQLTHGGAITETMHLAIQRDEAQPRRDQQRNNMDHIELRHRKMNDRFMIDAESDEMFR